jgi:hypothetical protein
LTRKRERPVTAKEQLPGLLELGSLLFVEDRVDEALGLFGRDFGEARDLDDFAADAHERRLADDEVYVAGSGLYGGLQHLNEFHGLS